MIFSILFTGCSKGTEQANKQPAPKETKQEVGVQSEAKQNEIMNGFNQILQENGAEREVIDFINKNISLVSKENASQMVLGLESVQQKNLEQRQKGFFEIELRLLKSMQEGSLTFKNGSLVTSSIQQLKDEDLKKLFEDNLAMGYKFICPEGSVYPIINYEMAYQQYGKYLTDEIKDYFEIMAIESENPFSVDAGLNVSWDEVYKRAVKSEKYLQSYPKSVKYKEIKQWYGWYAAAYIYGLDNSPAFVVDTTFLNEKLKNSYLNVAMDTESDLGKKIKDYLVVLKKNNFKLTDEVDQYRKGIIDIQEVYNIK